MIMQPNPEAHREKRLAHRLEDRRAGNLAEIGTQQEAYPFARAGQRQGVDGQRGEQDDKDRHENLGIAFDSFFDSGPDDEGR